MSPADRQRARKAAPLAQAHVVGAAGGVAADQNLVGRDHPLGIEIAAVDHLGLSVLSRSKRFTLPDIHGQADNGIVAGLPVHLGEHCVRLGIGEEAAALDGRQLRRIAEHQQWHLKRHEVARKLGIDHGALVDDDELRVRCRRLVPKLEGGVLLASGPAACRSAGEWSMRRHNLCCA